MKRDTVFYKDNTAKHTYTINSKSNTSVEEMELYNLLGIKAAVDILKSEVDTLAGFMIARLSGEAASEEQYAVCETRAYEWARLAMDILDSLPDCDCD